MSEQRSRLVIEINTANAERNARNIARELQNIERNGDFTSRSMDSLSSATRSLAGHMAGLVTIGTAVSKMDAYTGLQNRLKLVTNSQSELNTAMSDTFAIAQKTASSWDSTAMVYQRFADNADRLNISMKQTAGLTETVSKAISVSGGSAASADAALMQFGQALASGVLRGEEFNSIAEQAPGLLKAIAFGLDTNVGSLRAMAANGEITGDALVEALSKAKPYIDELFDKTDFTISQSFTKLSNEVTKFVGEAGKGSGAANALSGAIDVLASNLDTIANIAVVGGVALLTKAILTQTVAVHGSIASTIQRRAADTALLQSQIQLAALEVQRTRQVTALALTEINLARSELNSATTRQARAAATMRLTQAEIALSIAQKQGVASTVAQTAAENALNVARSRSAMLMGLVGGPIGVITIGVATLAAGYMYMSSRADEANRKLEEQAAVANRTAKELQALKGLERDNATNDMAAAFERQNKALSESSSQINMQLTAIKRLYAGNKEVVQVVNDAQKGTISMTQAVQKFNELRISREVYESVRENTVEFEKNAKEAINTKSKLSLYGVEVELAGRKAQTATVSVDGNTNALNDNANAANQASEAQSKYLDQLRRSNVEVMMTNKLVDAGWSPERAKAAAKLRSETGSVTKEGLLLIDQNIAANKKLQTSEDALKISKKISNSASKAALSQQKKDASEALRNAEELARMRYELGYRFSTKEVQLQYDLEKEKDDIRKAYANDPDVMNKYLDWAQKRFDAEKRMHELYLAQELNSWRLSESEKLALSKNIELERISLSTEYSKEEKEFRKKSVKDLFAYEEAQIKLTQETRIFQASQATYLEMDLISKKYDLERRRIMEIQDLEERNAMLTSSRVNQSREESSIRDDALSNFRNVMGFEESPLIGQFEILDKMRELDLLNEEAYQNAKLELQAKSTAGYMEGMLGGFASLVDENSKTYAVLFAAQKAFAVAQAMLNIPAAYSKAYDAVVGTPYIGPYIAPAVGAAAAALQVAQAASIKSTNMSGFKSGGYTGNVGVNQEAGVVHGQEYVLNAEATKRVGVSTLNAINSGANINSTQNQNTQPAATPIHQTINNVVNWDDVPSVMAGPAGQKVTLNIISRNRTQIKSLLGV